MKRYIKSNYYKVTMRYRDDNGDFRYYNAYTTGYDTTEAKINVYDELLDDEKLDQIDYIEEISGDEYRKGYARFGDGIRE